MAEFGGVVASYTNSERERLTIERAGSATFAGQLLLVIHDDPPLSTQAPMLLDEGTRQFLRTFLCLRCEGEGFIREADHGCRGDEDTCRELCPVEYQRKCPACHQDQHAYIGASPDEEPF